MLGFLALGQVFKTDEEPKKLLTKLWISAGLTGGLSLFFALLGGSFFSFNGANDAQLASSGLVAADIVADRKALFSGDAWRSFFLIALCAGLIWAWVTKKINSTIAIAGIGLLTIFDVWGVGRRYVSPKSFVTKTDCKTISRLVRGGGGGGGGGVVAKICLYRVHEVKPDAFQWAMSTYFHKTIGGLQPNQNAAVQRRNRALPGAGR